VTSAKPVSHTWVIAWSSREVNFDIVESVARKTAPKAEHLEVVSFCGVCDLPDPRKFFEGLRGEGYDVVF